MSYEQRDNSGTLFKNNKKEKDTHPDMNGTVMINGVEYYISAWKKQGRNSDFLSLSFKEKTQRSPNNSDDSDEPF